MKQRSTVLTIITVICGFYLYELFDSGIIGTFALISTEYLQQSNQWYRLVTVALVHDNSSSIPIHLAFNMLALHSLGSPIEKLLGRARFLMIFFGSLIFASLFSALNLGYNGYSIGVSGAEEVAVACPFCRVMVGDGMVARQSDVEVLDVAQILLRSVKQQ